MNEKLISNIRGHTIDCNFKKDYQIVIIFGSNISYTTGY